MAQTALCFFSCSFKKHPKTNIVANDLTKTYKNCKDFPVSWLPIADLEVSIVATDLNRTS